MDYQGGQGNGLAWYCNDFDAPVLMSSIYGEFQAKPIGTINPQDIKDAIALMVPSAQAAPILNYLVWLLGIVNSIQ